MALLLIPECRSSIGQFMLAMVAAICLFLLTALLNGLLIKVLFSSLLLLLFGLFVWYWVLQQNERNWLLRMLHLRPV
jgi:Flp pilus assembly protein TadB